MKLLSNYKYYIFSLLGWIIYVVSTLALDKISYGIDGSAAISQKMMNFIHYALIESVLCGLLGYLLSFILLYFVENYFKIGEVKRKDWIFLILVFVAVQWLYHLILWPMLNIATNYYFGRGIELTFFMKLTNVPYFAVAFLVWLFVILSIKVYGYLNEVKFNRLELESTLKESQLNALKGQINPHFMFNSLNNIRGLILENPDKSREMITRLSEMLRYSLTKSEVNTIALEEEIEMVENFIAISKIQLEDRLQFVSDIAEDSKRLQIPPMIIQMLVENAVKHGISQLKEGGVVLLKIKMENADLHIEVNNTGQLSQEVSTTQVGLKNIQRRLRLLYGEIATFELNEIENEVIAKILIPIS
jgi:two-component system LytT family sensor kinase